MPEQPPVQPRFFRARRDWWVLFGGFLFLIFFLLMVPAAFWLEVPLWQQIVMSGVGLILTLSTVDKLFFTVYELGPDGLSVHSQLRKFTVPYRAMRSIAPGGVKGLLTTRKRKRYAFSRSNLLIQVQNQLWHEISVSPYGQEAFLKQLLATIDAERSRRATVNRISGKQHKR